MIPFNVPYLTGDEFSNIQKAIDNKWISGNGSFTKKCHAFFQAKYGFRKTLLTSSCTDALEMAAILIDIQPGDEVIIPSYTFVSSANAFVLRGAKIVFADCQVEHPGMSSAQLEDLITDKTKAIVVVHYAGVACEMEQIIEIAKRYNLFLIEDAAQAIESYYTFSNGEQRPLGSLGNLAAFSFHETKNIISGEGGLLVINDDNFVERAEIIWEKGTNRSAFYRGEIDKYGWVDIGSSFLPSDMIAAFLMAQLNKMNEIQNKRLTIWTKYFQELLFLQESDFISLPFIPDYATNNAHMFYILMKNVEQRDRYIAFMREQKINPVFHYLSLHKSEFYKNQNTQILPEADRYSDTLVRLPFYTGMTEEEQQKVIDFTCQFFNG